MGKSYERDDFFGKHTEHYDDNGNKIGESRERDGLFGKYTEHTDASGNKIGESRERDGLFGKYTEHTGTSGNKTGESREREGVFGNYTEHTDSTGKKTGDSYKREGLFGSHTEHYGTGHRGDEGGDSSSNSSGCFITSACIEAKGLIDNCYELNTLRRFRDQYILSLPEGQQMMDEYYAVAPAIVKRIKKQENAKSIFSIIYDSINIAIKQIENGELDKALSSYKILVGELTLRYIEK